MRISLTHPLQQPNHPTKNIDLFIYIKKTPRTKNVHNNLIFIPLFIYNKWVYLHSVALFCSLYNMDKIKVMLLILYFMILEKRKFSI